MPTFLAPPPTHMRYPAQMPPQSHDVRTTISIPRGAQSIQLQLVLPSSGGRTMSVMGPDGALLAYSFRLPPPRAKSNFLITMRRYGPTGRKLYEIVSINGRSSLVAPSGNPNFASALQPSNFWHKVFGYSVRTPKYKIISMLTGEEFYWTFEYPSAGGAPSSSRVSTSSSSSVSSPASSSASSPASSSMPAFPAVQSPQRVSPPPSPPSSSPMSSHSSSESLNRESSPPLPTLPSLPDLVFRDANHNTIAVLDRTDCKLTVFRRGFAILDWLVAQAVALDFLSRRKQSLR
ncbi:uncharacterized protein BJ171DRAFT_53858 [Polychytrium aggregatum]|uniref:uncharacterized protein n=1 Tax=Polychytrium aggregatum TaxID=110093 RepID=UPI0022FF11A2|nr:uncharacterized protein BJ171DRAFT_53858 [Polychytrium aggregatum]KAI9205839.1 hypothetical protein BJ171DRAFT_53858 [Polychytrium aggregatum]